MIRRIRVMYEKGDSYILDMMLKAESFSDFLNRADFMDLVMAYDRQQWKEFMENRKYIALCKEELEAEKQILDEAKAGVEQEQANMEALIDQKSRDITAYESDISNKEQAIKEYKQSIADQDAEIAALEAAIAAEKKRILEASGTVLTYDGGVFKFPLASYTRISDDYGNRIHPTLGIEQFHNGVDFAAPKGTAIYAAYDGQVVAATYSNTMGNYVMIDHGGGGNRSKLRRYDMGEVTGEMADLCVLTCDNPRDEEIRDINNDIKVGLAKSNGKYIEIDDRKEAIAYCMVNAQPGDMIVLLGKGHEDYQEIRGVKYHFDEREAVAEILEEIKEGKRVRMV